MRIAAQNDGDGLLELTCRTVGDLLELEAVQCLIGPLESPEPGPLWRRSADSPVAVDIAKARTATLALGGEPGRVGEYVIVPLRAGRQWLGVLAGIAHRSRLVPPGAFEEAELVASHAATAHANLVRYQTVVAASLTDALTGLPNHRRFHEDGAALIDASRAGETGFSLVIADLDDFKDLNDRRGHVAGDDALRLVATLFDRGVRPDDRAYRVGGEEFALLLPATPKSNARTVCRRLQRALAANDLDGWKLTCSLGIAQFPDDGETIRDLLAAADAALYEAKRLGKDRITLADEALSARRTQGESMAARGRRSFEQMRHLQALAATLSGIAHHGGRRLGRAGRAVAGAAARRERAVRRSTTAALVLRAQRGPVATGADALRGYAERASNDRRAFLVDDATADHPSLAEVPLHGIVAAPLVAEDRAIGAIVVASSLRSRYDRDDQRLLEVIATVAGLAYASLRLLDAIPDGGLIGGASTRTSES